MIVLSALLSAPQPSENLLVFQNKASIPKFATLEQSNRLAQRLVELFNRTDGNGIKALALPEFFESIPEAVLPLLVVKVRSLGILSAPTLLSDLKEQRHYLSTIHLDGKPDRKMLMVLGAESDQKFYSLKMVGYRVPKSYDTPPSDNKLKSEIDQSVDSAVQRFFTQFKPSSLSIGVLDGKRSHFYNYGETLTGSKNCPTKQTVYEIGSITKTMTGLLVSKAINQKKLHLDADIRTYLPGKYPNLEYQSRSIHLRDLVTHTSALPTSPPGIVDDGKAEEYGTYSRERLFQDLAAISLTTSPGTKFSYSNFGAGLCGPIVETALGKPYERLLSDVIFHPAKMSNSGIALTPTMEANYATPYDKKGLETHRLSLNGIEAAGAVRSTAEDMVRYAILNCDRKRRWVALSQDPISPLGATSTGVFWQRDQTRLGGLCIRHEGGTWGFTSHILVFPSRRTGVVVLMNKGEQEAGDLAYEIGLRVLANRK